MAEVASKRMAGDLRHGPGELDACRSSADDDERQVGGPSIGVGFALGRFEGIKEPTTDLERVVERLQPGRPRCPLLMTEMGVLRAGCKDEIIVWDRGSIAQLDALVLGMERLHLAEDDLGVPVMAKHAPNGAGNVRGVQSARRDLVKQGLKCVVIPLVDDRDAHLFATKSARGCKASEASSDDDHVGNDHGDFVVRSDASVEVMTLS